MWHKYNRNQHSWASPFSFQQLLIFSQFYFLKVALGQKLWAFIHLMIIVKSITNIFGRSVKMKFTKEREKKKNHQSEKRNWRKMSSALPELMVIYVSYQFLFPPAKASFCHHDYLRTIDCWLTDGLTQQAHQHCKSFLPLRPLPVHVHSKVKFGLLGILNSLYFTFTF